MAALLAGTGLLWQGSTVVVRAMRIKTTVKGVKDYFHARRSARPTTSGEQSCLNCRNRFAGKYCNVCGQSADVEPYSYKSLLREFNHQIRKIDVVTTYATSRDLFKKPGEFIRDYLAGKRVGYVNPLKFYFYALVADILVRGALQRVTGDASFNAGLEADTNFQLLWLVSTGFWGVLWKIFYRDSGLHPAEFAICAIFFVAQTTLIGTAMLILSVPVRALFPSTQTVLAFINLSVSGVYSIYLAHQVFKESWLKTLLKQTVLIVLYVIFLAILILGVSALRS